MRFKEFLMEQDDVSFDGFTNSLNTIINRELFLWRGLYFQDGKLLASPWVNTKDGSYQVGIYKFSGRTSDRVSVTGDNTILSIMSKWKGFPNRSRSYFATQGRHHLDKFGEDYGLIIPSDQAHIFGYMPYDVNEPEHNSAGDRMLKKIHRFSAILRTIIIDLREIYQGDNESGSKIILIDLAKKHDAIDLLKADVFDRLTPQSFMTGINLCDDIYKSKIVDDLSTYRMLIDFIEGEGYRSIRDFIDDITPASFDAATYSLKNMPVDSELSSEIWFEGDYLAIKRYDLQDLDPDILVEILKELQSPTPKKEIEV